MENNQELEEGQIVLGTVEKIIGTTVFVKIENNMEGTLTTSEISPGRIRNLRDYVVPGKKIACKILRIDNRGIHLSLRRVKQNERKELLDKISKEKNNKAMLKTILGEEESEKIIKEITKKYTLFNFFEQVKKDSKILEEYVTKTDSKKILKILDSKKEKPKQIKQIFKLSSKQADGIKTIKNIINNSCDNKECNIIYLAAGKYCLSLTGENFKQLKTEIHKTLENLESQAKKQNCDFTVDKS